MVARTPSVAVGLVSTVGLITIVAGALSACDNGTTSPSPVVAQVSSTSTADASLSEGGSAVTSQLPACNVPPGVWGPGTCSPLATGSLCVIGQGCTPDCDSDHYEIRCTGSDPLPPSSLGCSGIVIPGPSSVVLFCCPCEAADASVDAQGAD
jgi:hypothetical protein